MDTDFKPESCNTAEAAFKPLQSVCNDVMRVASFEASVLKQGAHVPPDGLWDQAQTNAQVTENLALLSRLIQTMDRNVLRVCTEYVLLPLYLILPTDFKSRPKLWQISERRLEETLAAYHSFILKCESPFVQERDDIFFPILERCLVVLSSSQIQSEGQRSSNGKSPVAMNVSEETKLNAVRVLLCLLERGNETSFVLENIKLQGLIGHLVTILLALAQKERNRELRVLALQVLQCTLVQVRSQRTISKMLPGVTTSLFKVATVDYKEGSRLPSTAVSTLTIAVLLSLSDQALKGDLPEICKSFGEEESSELSNKLEAMVAQFASSATLQTDTGPGVAPANDVTTWVNSTWSKLQVILPSMFSSTPFTSSWRRSFEIVRFCSSCLRYCSGSMLLVGGSARPSASFGPGGIGGLLLEPVVAGTCHPNGHVERFARCALRDVEVELRRVGLWECAVMPGLQETFVRRMGSLAATAKKHNAARLKEAIMQLRGLGGTLGKWGASASWAEHLHEKVLAPLLETATLSTADSSKGSTLQVVTEQGTRPVTRQVYEYEKLWHEYLRDDDLVQTFGDMFCELVRSPFGSTLVNALVDECYVVASAQDAVQLPEYLFLLNQTIKSSEEQFPNGSEDAPCSDLDPGAVSSWVVPLQVKAATSVREEINNSSKVETGTDASEDPCHQERWPQDEEGKAHQEAARSLGRGEKRCPVPVELRTSMVAGPNAQPDLRLKERCHALIGLYATVFENPRLSPLAATLALRGVGEASSVLGLDMNGHLVNVLFPVLELAGWDRGASSSMVRLAAQSTLSRVSNALGLSSRSSLLLRNLDYLVDGIIARIPFLHEFPHLSKAIGAIAATVREDQGVQLPRSTLPLWSDVVRSILDEAPNVSLDTVPDLLKTLSAVVECLGYMESGSTQYGGRSTGPTNKETDTFAALLAEVNSLGEAYNVEVEDDDSVLRGDVEETEEPAEAHSPDEEDKELNYEDEVGKLVQGVILNCRYFLNHTSMRVRQSSARLVSLAARVMCQPENFDKNTLPTFHQVWPVLSGRLRTESNQDILATLFEVVNSLTIHVGDFMQPRFTSNVLPVALKILKESQVTRKKSGSDFRLHSDHRMERIVHRVLEALGCAAQGLGSKVFGGHTRLVAAESWKWLVQDEDPKARDLAAKLWEHFVVHDSEIVWNTLAAVMHYTKAVKKVAFMPGVEIAIPLNNIVISEKMLPPETIAPNDTSGSKLVQTLWEQCQSKCAASYLSRK